MDNELKHHENVSRSGLCVELFACDAELWNCGYEICKESSGRQRGLACVKIRPSIERRQSVM